MRVHCLVTDWGLGDIVYNDSTLLEVLGDRIGRSLPDYRGNISRFTAVLEPMGIKGGAFAAAQVRLKSSFAQTTITAQHSVLLIHPNPLLN
jgi:hypothetical protein